MAEFFSSLADSISLLIETVSLYITNLINSAITFYSVIQEALGFPSSLVGYLPYFIGASVLIVCSLAVIKIIF